MRRGEIWTLSNGGNSTGKPRPAVIVQNDTFAATGSVALCPFTSDTTEASRLRLPVEPSLQNGLQSSSRIMVDKIVAAPKRKLGKRIGKLDDDNIARLDRSLATFPALATSR